MKPSQPSCPAPRRSAAKYTSSPAVYAKATRYKLKRANWISRGVSPPAPPQPQNGLLSALVSTERTAADANTRPARDYTPSIGVTVQLPLPAGSVELSG